MPIDLSKCMERQKYLNTNRLDLEHNLAMLAGLKHSFYIYGIMSDVESFKLPEISARDHVKMEYKSYGKYEHQRDKRLIDIHTGDERNTKITITGSRPDGTTIPLKTVCEMYVDYVKESIEETNHFVNFKLEAKWSGFDTVGHCSPILYVTKD